jgi:hypothetical protein
MRFFADKYPLKQQKRRSDKARKYVHLKIKTDSGGDQWRMLHSMAN